MTIPAAERKKLERLAWRYVEAYRRVGAQPQAGTRAYDGWLARQRKRAEASCALDAFLDRLASRPQKRRGK